MNSEPTVHRPISKLTSTDAAAINAALRGSLVAAGRQLDLLAEVRGALTEAGEHLECAQGLDAVERAILRMPQAA